MSLPLLENNWVRLDPLLTSHIEYLWPIASTLNIYEYSPTNVSSKALLKTYIEEALAFQKSHTAIPFAIFDKKNNKYVGCTRFGYIDQKHKTLHIGWTWIAKESQGTGLNGSVKQLLLSAAFGPMGMRKVSFRVDALNIKSRKAVEKLGAQLEGILRQDVYVAHNRLRDTCCYAILKEDYLGPSSGSK